jgi:hypothetical protein
VGYTLDPAAVPPFASPESWARFCAKTIVTASHVIWVGGLSKGYGTFHDPDFSDLSLVAAERGETVTATRWMWTAHHGPIPDGLRVMHACDIPICLRLEDLALGTQQENIRAAADRDRLARWVGQVRVDRSDARGQEFQSRAIRTAVLEAVAAGITDAEALDWVVAAELAVGDPHILAAQTPLFPIEEIVEAERARRRRRLGAPAPGPSHHQDPEESPR